MELSIKQALQEGIAAHKQGNLQHAERLYRAILQSHPENSDANHNLGVLAVSANKVEAALPLFKAAVKANPKQEQFWLSYIDALIKGKQFENAKKVFEQAKTHGVAPKKLQVLQTEFESVARTNETKFPLQNVSLSLSQKGKKLPEQKKRRKSATTKKIKTRNPSQEQLHSLLMCYKNERFDDAKNLAASITGKYPQHQFAWTILGAVARATGRRVDAVAAYRKVVALSPKDPEAHYNLGIALQEFGSLREAERIYKKAIALKPDFATAQYNLGTVLQELGRLDESGESYAHAIASKSDFAEAHSNLGNVFQELGRLDKAEASYTRAIGLKPDYAEAHNNLGVTLQELGRLNEAEAIYKKTLELKPDYAEAHYNLGNILKELTRLEEAEASYKQAIALKPNYVEAYSNLGSTLQDLGILHEAEETCRHAVALEPEFASAHYNLGNVFKELGRFHEAEASYVQAIASRPDFPEAQSNLGITFKELGRFYEAEVCCRRALALRPGDLKTHSHLLLCLFLQDKKADFFDELDCLINQSKTSAIIGSLTCRSFLKYGLEKPNLFCAKPFDYVSHIDLNTRYEFKKEFIEKANRILNENQIPIRRQSLLLNGHQTSGNIFDKKNDETYEIQKIIRIEVEKYLEKHKKSGEGLIKEMPTEYILRGWLISMKSGGSLKPHIHTEGWLSGSIYINVPRKCKVDSGNLVVSLGEENDATDTRINKKKTINVVTGSMVLFPASLMHYTIPFESEEERIVLAFDVKEK